MPVSKFNNVLVNLEARLYAISEDSMLVYDSEKDSWRAMTPPPTTLYHAVAAATSGYLAEKMICVFSSDLIVSVFGVSKAGYTFIYFPENDSWIQSADMPTGRVYPGVAAYEDTIYVIGGFTPVVSDIVKTSNANERFLPPSFGKVPPRVHIITPGNGASYAGNVSLVFIVDKPVVWVGYSLSNQANITIHGNITLTGLPQGAYTIKVYVRDARGNTGASETIHFTITNQTQSTTESITEILITAIILAAATTTALVIWRKKHSRHSLTSST